MEPVGVWVRKGGEWALIHRCRACGALRSNRIAADDNPALLLSIALRPLAAGEQGALVALLREVQEERGGALPAADLAEIAAALSLRDTFLSAIIRRYPGLRTEEAPHRLELCGGPRCSGRGAARLAAFVEETYGVRPGGVSASGRFTYRITGCMKNCPNGPSLRWDGALHSRADEALIRALVDEGGGRPSP